MPQLFWNPLSINFLIMVLLTGILSAFFLNRTIAGREKLHKLAIEPLLFVAFSASALFIACQIFSNSLSPHLAPWFLVPSSILGVIALAAILLFACRFMRKTQTTNTGEKLLILMLFLIILSEVYIGIARTKLLWDGVVEYRASWISVPFGTLLLLLPLFFAGHLVAGHTKTAGGHWRYSIKPALSALLWPRSQLGHDTAAARAFFHVSMILALAALTLLLRSFGLIEWNLTILVTAWLLLLFLAGFALAYLNYIPERSSYREKLVGVTLTIILAILSGIGWSIGNVYSETYEPEYWAKSQSAIAYIPSQNLGYSVSPSQYEPDNEIGEPWVDVEQPIDLPFAFPFYDETYQSLYAHPGGMVGFDHLPRWQDIQYRFGPQPAIFIVAAELVQDDNKPDSGVFVKRENDNVTITWQHLVSKFSADEQYRFQLKLYSDGRVEKSYIDVPAKPRIDIFESTAAPLMSGIVPARKGRKITSISYSNALPLVAAPGQAIVEYHRVAHLEYLNRIYAPIAYSILAATLLIVIIFPLFFSVSLDRPLKKLINGVQEVMRGKLDTSIDIVHRDEIGFLASSFNDMTKAQKELIEELESRVVKRTAEASELAARNARLEERNHLSSELHDAVSQTLFSANLIADTLPELSDKKPKQLRDAVTQVQQLNKSALTEMRNLMLELSPRRLSSSTFGELLGELAEEFKTRHILAVDVQVEDDVALPEAVQLTFFRIAQECLANCGKHSQASQVTIYFDGMPTQAILTVQDDGKGFVFSEVTVKNLGLQIMEERMNRIGGSLEINSEPGDGVSVTAIWIENDTEE